MTGKRIFRCILPPLFGISIFVAVWTGAVSATSKAPLYGSYEPIIVLDPGHGGRESGARGPDGTTEKEVTLKLARLIAAELERDYEVVLTRTDDYHVDLDARTALANNLKADVFISLHTGGSFVYSTNGTIIYHYQNVAEGNPVVQGNDTDSPIEWSRVQDSYLKNSRSLARLINTRLNNLNSKSKSRIQGAPLVVLQGAGMPAILLEVGYLTNPAEEKNLRDNRFLTDLAVEISKGIEDFLVQKDR
jgi:N-acetylmuramoyl-L-alanine amidase